MSGFETSVCGGAKKRKFRWSRLHFEWGRYYYRTDCMGRDHAVWWEWEK